MRLPLVFDVDSRDGLANKDERFTNVLVGEKDNGEQVAELRPGLDVATVIHGNGNGLVCFDGNLISIYGTTLGDATQLPYYFGTLGGAYSRAMGVSSDGSVVVGYATTTSGNGNAFRWTKDDGMVSLGTLGGVVSVAVGVSYDGNTVTGYSTTASNHSHAFIWTSAGGMVDIGAVGGGNTTYATGISGDGTTVVGWGYRSDYNVRAFKWTSAGGMVELSTLDAGSGQTRAHGVSADGNVIVGFSPLNSSYIHAVKWTAGVIQRVISDDATSKAYAVSGDGNVIVGMNYFSDYGEHHAFKWSSVGGLEDLGSLGGFYIPSGGGGG